VAKWCPVPKLLARTVVLTALLLAAAACGYDTSASFNADGSVNVGLKFLFPKSLMQSSSGATIGGLSPSDIAAANKSLQAKYPGAKISLVNEGDESGALVTIRKFSKNRMEMNDLIRLGTLSTETVEFLQRCVQAELNILVSGGTGSGKTTTLNVIARFIPHNQRVITIEDAADLQLDHPHVIALEHRPANVEGKGELTIRQLLRNSLRMRPDRIIVGEVRGAEALDMLQAMNTGHDGSMSTIHSNSARDALSRLETMVMMASIDIPFEAVRAQIASAVNLIVHQARMPDGRRKVAQIAEVVGYDANGPILRDIFLLGMGSDLRLEFNATGYVPTALDKAAFYGVQVDQDLFDPVKSRYVPAGSDSMMPVTKDPLMSGQGKGETTLERRTVVVVPFSSERPASRPTSGGPAQAGPAPAAQTPEMQEEMRKLIEAARSAVADLQAVSPQQQQAEAPRPPVAEPAQPADASAPRPSDAVPVVYPTQQAAQQAAQPPPQQAGQEAATPQPYYHGQVGEEHGGKALEAATAMVRATTALGQLAAASSGFGGMLPTIRATEGAPGPAGASRRIQAVIETIITRRGLSLRLAPALTQAFEGAELKGSDYAGQTKISKESAGRELRLAAEAGLLQTVRYQQGEAGFRASQGLLREIAEGLGQPINASAPLTAETIIGSLAVGQTEGTVTIMFTDVEESTRLLSTRGFTTSHEIMKAYETIIDEKVSQHAGRRIKGLGDGFMISFGSARHGVECALDIQQAIGAYSKQNPERKLRIRIGLNTGEVVEEAGDIFGAAVNVAARVAGKARGGEILVSEIVRQLVGPTEEMKFDFRGRYKLKGFPDRWRLHQVMPGEVKESAHVVMSGDGFVDRDRERLDLRMILERASIGSGSVTFLAGPPGIGTSRLASEVAGEAATKGWMVLSGRCRENDAETYAPFREILAAAVAGSTAKTLQEAAGTHGPLLTSLVPGLRQKVRGMAAPHEVPADKLREQLFKSIHGLLTGIQGVKPLLILLDDLQWADEATVLLLRDLSERVGASRMVVIGTYWDSELESGRPFATMLSRMLRRRRAQRIPVGRLTDKDVERIVAGMAETPLSPIQLIGIQAATEGNPLFVEHSFLYLAESESMFGGGARAQASFTEEDLELAQSVRGLIGRRIQRLSEPAQRMLVAAAVIDRDFDIALLEAFGELAGHELRDALDEATRGHFLVAAGPQNFRFAHDLVRQRVLGGLPMPRVQAYHLAVADTLERVYGKSAPDHSAEIGFHLYQAGTAADAYRTATFLGHAAKNALAVGAFEEVLRLVDSTVQLLPADKTKERAEALAVRAQALFGLGRMEDAKSAWQGAIQRYDELGDSKAATALHHRIARLETRHQATENNGAGPAEEPAPAPAAAESETA